MEQNKLKLEDYMLTLCQTKVLQRLGVDMSNSIYLYVEDHSCHCPSLTLINRTDIKENDWPIMRNKFDVTDTLTNSEILEMLPQHIMFKQSVYDFTCCRTHDKWYVGYERCQMSNCISFRKTLLRDALFETLAWIKTN